MVVSLRKAKNESFLNSLLSGKDADFQRRVLAISIEHGLSTNDPLFLVMLATGQLQVLLEDKPKELEFLFKRWSESIYDHLDKAKHTAVSAQEVEISKMVDRLIAKSESKQLTRFRIMLPAFGLLLAAIGFGVLAGLSVPVWLGGGYTSQSHRLLTVADAETLRWAQSSQGKLARNILAWNSDSLTNLNCTKSSAQNALVAKEKGNRLVSDYCLLRVKNP